MHTLSTLTKAAFNGSRQSRKERESTHRPKPPAAPSIRPFSFEEWCHDQENKTWPCSRCHKETPVGNLYGDDLDTCQACLDRESDRLAEFWEEAA